MTDLCFYLVAVLTILSSLGVVGTRNMLHAAIFLVASFTTTALLYLLLNAEFAAIMQVVIYIGGIVVVFVFIILLTSQLGDAHLPVTWTRRVAGWTLPLVWSVVAAWLVYQTAGDSLQRVAGTERFASMDKLAALLLASDNTGYLLPFEIISLLLLAAVIGAIVIARRTPESSEAPR